MILKLLKGLSKKEQLELKENFTHSLPLRKRLIDVMNEEVETLVTSMTNEGYFNSPKWELIQADKVAQIKSLRKFISFLKKSKINL